MAIKVKIMSVMTINNPVMMVRDFLFIWFGTKNPPLTQN